MKKWWLDEFYINIQHHNVTDAFNDILKGFETTFSYSVCQPKLISDKFAEYMICRVRMEYSSSDKKKEWIEKWGYTPYYKKQKESDRDN